MKPVLATNAVFDAIQRVKAQAPAFCTNFFPVQKKLQGWVDQAELFGEFRDGAAFFLRKDRDFSRLYFCAADAAALREGLDSLPEVRTGPVVTDLVGSETALGDMLGALAGAGFRRYSRLQRMARAAKPHAFQPAAAPVTVVCAEKSDQEGITQLLEGAFDWYADQLPSAAEIAEAIDSRQILIVRSEGAVAALLHFETTGFTSVVRFWAVAGAFRSRQFGSALMRQYFESQTGVKRFILWVVADNLNAVQKYQHYGYAADGLIDHVLANQMVKNA